MRVFFQILLFPLTCFAEDWEDELHRHLEESNAEINAMYRKIESINGDLLALREKAEADVQEISEGMRAGSRQMHEDNIRSEEALQMMLQHAEKYESEAVQQLNDQENRLIKENPEFGEFME